MIYGNTYVVNAIELAFPLLERAGITAFQFDPRKSYVTPIPDDGRVHVVCQAGHVGDITAALDNGKLYVNGANGQDVMVHPTDRLPTNRKYHCIK
jgi:hypothetical protein